MRPMVITDKLTDLLTKVNDGIKCRPLDLKSIFTDEGYDVVLSEEDGFRFLVVFNDHGLDLNATRVKNVLISIRYKLNPQTPDDVTVSFHEDAAYEATTMELAYIEVAIRKLYMLLPNHKVDYVSNVTDHVLRVTSTIMSRGRKVNKGIWIDIFGVDCFIGADTITKTTLRLNKYVPKWRLDYRKLRELTYTARTQIGHFRQTSKFGGLVAGGKHKDHILEDDVVDLRTGMIGPNKLAMYNRFLNQLDKVRKGSLSVCDVGESLAVATDLNRDILIVVDNINVGIAVQLFLFNHCAYKPLVIMEHLFKPDYIPGEFEVKWSNETVSTDRYKPAETKV